MDSWVVNFGRVAADYGRWRQGFPPQFFARLDGLGIGQAGQRILDLGTGTGLLARAFARQDCRVTGLDLSVELIEEARKADRAVGVSIDYVLGPAEYTGLPDNSFDVVSAGTCWHWFDRAAVAREAARVLRPDGRLVIAHLDWHLIRGNVVHMTFEAIDRFAPQDTGGEWTFQYPQWTIDLKKAGFDAWEVFGFTAALDYSHEAWLGRVRASRRVGPAMSAATLEQFETELARLLRDRFSDDVLAVDHAVFAIVAWRGRERQPLA